MRTNRELQAELLRLATEGRKSIVGMKLVSEQMNDTLLKTSDLLIDMAKLALELSKRLSVK